MSAARNAVMATDFFDRQDHARRQTVRLLVMFAFAVAAIIVAIYMVVVLGMGAAEERHYHAAANVHLWNPLLFAWVAAGTILVVGLGSLYKISELSAGGEQIALMLGGRAINPQTTDLAERRLLNVVEEMALASGIPVPPVFVMDNEASINAFAAGHQPGDAVVAVSAGSLQYLTREELQGVMAHEFSHILNGDMRLNLRLIGVVYGILVLAIVGYYIMRTAGVSRGSKKDGGGIVILGMALLVFGYIGVFFGNLIKSAISRQREFLADASAVQFTRYPGGIAGALKKIGGLSEGSRIRDAHAEEISHMFFGNAFATGFFDLFATHPPLEDRIRALEPDFDGHFPEVEPVAVAAETVEAPPVAAGRRGALPIPTILPGGAALPVAMALDGGTMVQRIGRPRVEHLSQASQIVGDMPQELLEAAREPFLAQAVIYALLLSPSDDVTRSKQMELLQGRITAPLYQHVQQLAAAAQALPATARLPLVDLAIPALKKSSAQQYAQFREIVDALVEADGTVDLFEYCLRTMLFNYLDVNFGLKRPPVVRYRTAGAVSQPIAVVLSTLAYVGQNNPDEVAAAFQAGVRELPVPVAILPSEQCTLRALDAALVELSQASPQVKRAMLAAATSCIGADQKVTLEESELLRAVAAVLACPVPPTATATCDG
jgi:Zn-dependent protease with chaperone function